MNRISAADFSSQPRDPGLPDKPLSAPTASSTVVPSSVSAATDPISPWVSVHVLSEFLFCPRAGLLALESADDSGDEEPELGPRLDYLPDYDLAEIVAALQGATVRLRRLGMLLAPAGIVSLALWQLISPWAGLLAAGAIVYLLGLLWDTLRTRADLSRRQQAAAAASELKIDLASAEVQRVNWWSLRKAGFDCIKPCDSYRDPGLRLTGKPWRILVRGSLRIPVIRKHRGQADWGRQHLARAAAYCQLIAACEGAQSPCGILLLAGSYDCVVIPHQAAAQEAFCEAFVSLRRFLAERVQSAAAPPAPTDNRCAGCHQGCPRRQAEGCSETVLAGQPLPCFGTRARNGRVYHSSCGDRFRWVPPHEKALSLGISRR